MSQESTYQPNTGIERWIDERLPIIRLMHGSFVVFPTPRNLNYWWTFGGILTFCLMVQIVTGIVLAMHYTADVGLAFASIEHIMRDVNFGWLLRYVHGVGGSMFFLAVYIHIFRGMYYGSYKAPREILWILGMLIYVLMMATAFMGYVLVWGQMSFWAATVITGIFTAIPFVGEPIQLWLLGGFAVDNPTLTRFFSLHYLLPFVTFGVVMLHVWALHVVGSNNPTGIEVKGPQDTLPFTPYYTVKDAFAVVLFMLIFAGFVFWAPNALSHPDNYIQANAMVTPTHIVPEWYLLPFYAILKSITFGIGIPFTGIEIINAKLLGVIAMFGSIIVIFLMPWLDTSKVKSMRYRPMLRPLFLMFLAVCIGLGWVGAEVPSNVIFAVNNFEFTFATLGLILTVLYFAYFIIALPLVGLLETPKPMPASIEASVLQGRGDATSAE